MRGKWGLAANDLKESKYLKRNRVLMTGALLTPSLRAESWLIEGLLDRVRRYNSGNAADRALANLAVLERIRWQLRGKALPGELLNEMMSRLVVFEKVEQTQIPGIEDVYPVAPVHPQQPCLGAKLRGVS